MLFFILSVIALCCSGYVEATTWSSCMLIKNTIERLECQIANLKNISTQCKPKVCGPCACYTDCKHLKPMRDCLAFKDAGYNVSGLYRIHMKYGKHVEVYCDQETDNGGWTVFQRRANGKTEFYRDWKSYKIGFGNLQGEHWLGNQNIYLLALQAEYPKGSELRVDMGDWDGKKVFAKYSIFSIENEYQKYRLTVGGYSGNAEDSLTKKHNGQKFSTHDQDNDVWGKNCAATYHGAWWYEKCHAAHLNGEYRKTGESVRNNKGVSWPQYKNKNQHYSMKFVEMKVRRKK